MKKSREQKDTEELTKFPYENQISPIQLKIEGNIWYEFKKRVPKEMNLNHAIEYLITKFIFIENGDFKNINLNDLYEKILKKEKNFILLYGEDYKGNKYIHGKMVKKEVKNGTKRFN